MEPFLQILPDVLRVRAGMASAADRVPHSVLQQHACKSAAADISACIAQITCTTGMLFAAVASKLRLQALPPATRLAAALHDWHSQPEQLKQSALVLAQAAAGRSCAYLCCANLGGEGGPAAKQGVGSKSCRCEGPGSRMEGDGEGPFLGEP